MEKIEPTIKSSLKIIISGFITLFYVIGRNINKFVKTNPWISIISLSVIYVLTILFIFVNCRQKQITAEYQRDSISYQFDRITNIHLCNKLN